MGMSNISNVSSTSKNSITNSLGADRVKLMMKNKLENQEKMIQGSFTDIESLRQNAEQMIELARQIRAKVCSGQMSKSENEEINKILGKIGFVDPITKEVAGSDYYKDLGSQINSYFSDYFKKFPETKALTLIDAYCIYNRARGANIISPKDMKQAINNLQSGTIAKTIVIKNFNNEMIVISSPEFSDNKIMTLITNFLTENKSDSIELNDLSKILNFNNVMLDKIIIEDLLSNGLLLIDDNDLEVRYYLNKILSYKI